MQTRPVVLCALLVLVATACQPAPPAALSDADRAAIEAQEQNFARLALSHSLDSLVNAYYTDDAIFMAPNAPAATGRAAILAVLNGFPPFTTFEIKTVEINGGGGDAWVRGTYNMVMAPPGGAPMPDNGKYLEIWKKQGDGTWKVTRDMFNSDVPLPMPAPAPNKP
ncbi:MAG TPA: nuclear transport factor 2 family protein [Gemmatimonadales bacterium]|jgi:ketosteroid isomerase-like protein|nr:nuclear transport factor 2 family protein [Gemmatimonadales bacterium]